MTKGTPVKVVWLDSDCSAGWDTHEVEQELLPEEAYLTSVGVFISRGPKFVTISFAYNEESEDVLGKHRIPIGMIKDIIQLTEIDNAQS